VGTSRGIFELRSCSRSRLALVRTDLSLAAAGALGLFVATGEGNHSAAKELREGVEGKLAEKVELAVDANKDVVERLLAARMRLAKKASAAETPSDASGK
jgi:hypothetical protein